jgi:hypothetical protein
MAQVTVATIGQLADLIPSFEQSLRAADKAPGTRQGFADAARRLNVFLEASGMPTEVAKLRRDHVEYFIDHLVQAYKPATAANRFRSLQQLFKWLGGGGRGGLADGADASSGGARGARARPRRPRAAPTARHLRRQELRRAARTAILSMFLDTGRPDDRRPPRPVRSSPAKVTCPPPSLGSGWGRRDG